MSTLAKYRLLLGPQVTASVNASVNTSVDLSHPRVLGAASYVYYENGSVITPTMSGTPLSGQRTGRANNTSYQYQVAVVDARGMELSQRGVNDCVAKGLSVIQGDADTDLVDYPDDGFDYVILSQTIQATRQPRRVLEQMLPLAYEVSAIVARGRDGDLGLDPELGLAAAGQPRPLALRIESVPRIGAVGALSY